MSNHNLKIIVQGHTEYKLTMTASEDHATATDQTMRAQHHYSPIIVEQAKKLYCKHGMNAIYAPSAAVIASIVLSGNAELLSRWIFYPAYTFTLTIVGTALGIGLGLGLATHVYDYLTDLAHRDQKRSSLAEANAQLPRPSTPKGIGLSSKNRGQSISSAWDDDTVYSSLMSSAGYDVSDHILRAQIIKRSSPFLAMNYPFTDAPETHFKAVQMIREIMPHLAAPVSLQLGKFIEHIMRDYVSSWYSMVDGSVTYEDEARKRTRLAEATSSNEVKEYNNGTPRSQNNTPTSDLDGASSEPKQRIMLLSTTGHRPVPMMGSMYTSLALMFGNLAQRVEGVNLLSLILLKWTKVIGHTLKVYRQMRNKALAKSMPTTLKSSRRLRASASKTSSSSHITTEEAEDKVTPLTVVSEMAVTREFLMNCKLHRAVTFGMDVPSLLYADSKGEDCGIGDSGGEDLDLDEDKVLEMRLFGTKMLYECELDYNRVLGNRLARALLPRAEYSSPLIRSMVTELLAGCVLTPVMGCFCPSYLNGWILQACTPNPDNVAENTLEVIATGKVETGPQDEIMEDSVEMRLEEANIWKPVQESEIDVEDGQGQELTMSMADIIARTPSVCSSQDAHEMSSASFFRSSPLKDLLSLEEEDHNQDAHSGTDDEDTIDESGTGRVHSASISLRDENDKASAPVVRLPPTGDFILPLLTMSLIDLQGFCDFEDCREGRTAINWDDIGCQTAVTQLVLVLEAALIHGRRNVRLEAPNQIESDASTGALTENNNGVVELSVAKYEPDSLINVLMDMTSDLEGFQERIMKIEDLWMEDDVEADSLVAFNPDAVLRPSEQELATTRTLVAAWLHSGQAHRVITVLMNAPNSLLVPFYHKHSFLRTPQNAVGFVRQLRSLDGVPILVDTLSVLSSANMDVNEHGCSVVPTPYSERHERNPLPLVVQQNKLTQEEVKRPSKSGRFSRLMGVGAFDAPENETEPNKASPLPVPQAIGTATPKYLDFRKNENFAASLRSERDRRTQSWLNATATQETTKGIPVICRSKGASEASIAFQRELHQVSRILYAGTNMLSLRSGGRRKNSGEQADGAKSEILPLSLLTIEMASQKRRIEVPDEDSSFLLRAQPRPLVAVGVHRDPRNHDQSYKCFAATYEEPLTRQGSSKHGGAKYIRRCLLKYYPNDRTASIELPNDGRQLDQRQDRVPETVNLASSPGILTGDFLKERHLCQKWAPKGSVPRSGSLLASSVMETTDFTAAPRSGKAIDFVYRVSLFERPMVDLDGKKFTVYDSSATGTHRADASSLEISDAALSLALLHIGRDWDYDGDDEVVSSDHIEKGSKHRAIRRSNVEVGKDGYPVLFLKYNRKQGDGSVTEVKPYRSSHIRAAILITEARQEAQQMCLTKCVMAGSARSATKSRTEALLWPTVTLLDYASSPEREKQSILLRDLKLGINHIDREQLRRNGLLVPRYPTIIRSLTAQIEGATTVKEPGHAILAMAPTVVMFRIRCVAIVELCEEEIDEEDRKSYKSSTSDAKVFREEWTVWRQFQDFAILHKQLKSQVAPTEQSVSAGARLVGAATAAFSVGGIGVGPRRRQALIPSLGQATKSAGLGLTKKSIQKRCAVTDSYLKYLLSPNHLLNRCSELLLFLGASCPLPSEVVTGGSPMNPVTDPFGRVDIIRNIHIAEREVSRRSIHESEDIVENKSVHFRSDASLFDSLPNVTTGIDSVPSNSVRSIGTSSSVKKNEAVSLAVKSTGDLEEQPSRIAKVKEISMIPSIKAKIDEVPLSQVRHAIFDLIRYQFDFDNASFFRNRMFAAMKTMSFAVTTSGEFRKMLYENHVKFVNAEALAGWVHFTLDMIWPDGVFFTSSPALTPDEEISLASKAKLGLGEAFPDQIKAVLGQNITQNGLDILHEMLQNRMVTKSMAYMLFDLLWLEIFPELQDILTCGSALDEE